MHKLVAVKEADLYSDSSSDTYSGGVDSAFLVINESHKRQSGLNFTPEIQGQVDPEESIDELVQSILEDEELQCFIKHLNGEDDSPNLIEDISLNYLNLTDDIAPLEFKLRLEVNYLKKLRVAEQRIRALEQENVQLNYNKLRFWHNYHVGLLFSVIIILVFSHLYITDQLGKK